MRQSVIARLQQTAAADVVDQQQPALLRNPPQLRQRRLLREADNAEVAAVHAQQRRALVRNRRLIIRRAGAVGRADLDQRRARLPQHIGNAETAADLHRLPARDDHLSTDRVRRQRQIQRRRVVVHHQRRLRARQRPQRRVEVVRTAAPRASCQVELQIRVERRLLHRRRRRVAQRRAPQIGMNDHPGRIDHRPQARRERRVEPLGHNARQRIKLRLARLASENRRANPLNLLPRRLGCNPPWQPQIAHSRVRKHTVDAGQRAERMRHMRHAICGAPLRGDCEQCSRSISSLLRAPIRAAPS